MENVSDYLSEGQDVEAVVLDALTNEDASAFYQRIGELSQPKRSGLAGWYL